MSRSGLVLNLANQFEAVSKPNTPSPIDEQLKESQPEKTEIEPPVISQTKPPASRHEAVLVKPTVCSNCISVCENTKSGGSGDGMQDSHQEPLRSISSTSIDSGVSCQNKAVEVPTTEKSAPSCTGAGNCCSLSPKKDNKSEHSIPSSLTTKFEIDVIRSASSGSVPGNSIFYCNPCESPEHWRDSCFSYEKEDIPWTPGTVWRTKEQLEENTLKRTKSFDSALKLSSGKLSSTDGSNHVQRSQSLSVHQRGINFLASLSSPPRPPVRTTSIRRSKRVIHSSSSPSLSRGINFSPPKSTPVLRPNPMLQHCDSDEGLVMSVQNTPKCKPKEASNSKSKTTWYDVNEDEASDSVGVVRRLTQELEAKTREPSLQKEHSNRELVTNNVQASQRRPNRARVKSENMSCVGCAEICRDVSLQRSCSTGSVSRSSSVAVRKNQCYYSQPLRRKNDFSPFSVITSQNLFSDSKRIPVSKPPPANKSFCWKVRKHQQDYGKNHPVNKIVSRALQENAFKAL